MKFPKIGKILRKTLLIIGFALWGIGLLQAVGLGYAHATMAEDIQEWLPSIIELAMLGMFMGLIGKMTGKLGGK